MVFSDAAVIVALQTFLAPAGQVLLIASSLGDESILACFVVAVYAAGRRRAALALAGALIASAALNLALKSAFRLERPPEELALASASGYSFPSGHAQVASTFWSSLRAKVAHPLTAPLGIAVVALVCVSRVYLGVHYLGDVVAGAAVGAAATGAFLLFEPRIVALLARPGNEHLAGWAGAALVAAGAAVALNPFQPSHGTMLFILGGLGFAHALQSDLPAKVVAKPDWLVRLAVSLSLSTPLFLAAELLPPVVGAVPAVFAGLVGATAAQRLAARVGA